MSFPRYERYKDSGVEWLGELPEGWQIKPIKAVASCNDDVLPESTPPEYAIEYVEISGVNASEGIKDTSLISFESAPSRARRRVRAGDVIVSTVRTYLKAITPVSEPPDNLIVSTGFAVIRPKHLNCGYLGYACLTEYLIGSIIANSVGVSYPAINASDLMLLKVPLPSLSEQQAIAAFLNCETTKIDGLIAEQENLIALLKEKRQAVISHAVTKGLNPDAPMKDSGVEWLGEVPEGWELYRLRRLIKLNPSKTVLKSMDRDTEVSFLPMEAIGDDGSLCLDQFRPICEVESGYTFFCDGDITVAKITPCFENGKGALMAGLKGGIGFGTTELIVIRPGEKTIGRFLHWLFVSPFFRKNGEATMYGAGGQKHVPDDFVRSFLLANPPLPEQQAIVDFLDNETAKLDGLTTEAQRAIELLKERRSALISAAVTGKIDVRNAA